MRQLLRHQRKPGCLQQRYIQPLHAKRNLSLHEERFNKFEYIICVISTVNCTIPSGSFQRTSVFYILLFRKLCTLEIKISTQNNTRTLRITLLKAERYFFLHLNYFSLSPCPTPLLLHFSPTSLSFLSALTSFISCNFLHYISATSRYSFYLLSYFPLTN
jgi:hypothetical protein